ncbi:MAG: pseudouridylate synthase [Tannerella sp.]|jgi:predicted hotdog family 3-hydroxylacyl-ACP dehydratase|nr:pseudouridylate synthase [Tannerella sp.]
MNFSCNFVPQIWLLLNLTEIDITDILPQRPPFILVDRLTYYDPRKAITLYTVREGHFFCADGKLEEAGLVENIAQTGAVRTGYETKYGLQGDGVIRIGLIGAIRKMDIRRAPCVGEQLETTVVVVEDIFSISLVEAKVEIGSEVIATCEMKIFLTEINAG